MAYQIGRDQLGLAIRAKAPVQPIAAQEGSAEPKIAKDGLSLQRASRLHHLSRGGMSALNSRAPNLPQRDGQAEPRLGVMSRLWTWIKGLFGATPPAPPKPVAPRNPLLEAEFSKLVGVDGLYARLLVAAGYTSLKQIANTAPETVQGALTQANAKYGIAQRMPTLETTKAWVGDAKRLTAGPVQPPVAPPAEPLIKAWFADNYDLSLEANLASSKANKDNPEKHMVALIDSVKAGGTIDAALFELDEESVVDAFVRAKVRGVDVRLVTDTDYYYEKDGKTPTPPIQKLLAVKIPIVQDERGPLMHDKFMVVNHDVVWTGSFNVSENAAFKQNNNAIQLTSKELADNFQAEFDEMFVDRKFGNSSPRNVPHPLVHIGAVEIETLFSEDDVNKRLAEEVRKHKSVQFMAFSFTDDGLGQAIKDVAANGGTVSGVFEKVGATTKYSEYPAMKALGLDVHVDGNPTFMHHKVIILGDSTLITGSFNFSGSADDNNDENLLIIRNAPELVKEYKAEYERVKATAIRGEAAKPLKATKARDGAVPLPQAA